MNSSFILDKDTKMTVEGSTIKSRIKSLLRSPSIKLRRSKPGNNKENLSNKVCSLQLTDNPDTLSAMPHTLLVNVIANNAPSELKC